MSEIITTLHEKGQATNEVYPNIKSDNIPEGAVTTPKIANLSVNTSKLDDSSVTTDKIVDKAVTIDKLSEGIQDTINVASRVIEDDGTIDTENIYCDDLHVDNNFVNTSDTDLHNLNVDNDVEFDLTPTCNEINHFAVLIADDYSEFYSGVSGFVNCKLSSYTNGEIQSALDIDKSNIADFSSKDIEILERIFTNIIPSYKNNTKDILIANETKRVRIQFISNEIKFTIYDITNGVYIYELTINTISHTITTLTNTGEYITIDLIPLKMML